jgi:hypothetical protein
MCTPTAGIRLLSTRNGYSLYEVLRRDPETLRDGHDGFRIDGPAAFESEFTTDSDEAARRFLELAPIARDGR